MISAVLPVVISDKFIRKDIPEVTRSRTTTIQTFRDRSIAICCVKRIAPD
jgi:hypothetical protein